jgi:transposase
LKSTDEEQVKQVKTLVENEPKNLNRVVGQIKSKMNIDLSKKTLQRFLKNLNIYENASAEG